MKHPILILFLFIALGANAQTDTTKLTISGSKGISGSIWSTGCDTCKVKLSAYTDNGFLLKSYYFTINTYPNAVMRVSAVDSAGNYKIWIDRKRMVWTSDSTFILKTK